MLTQSRYAALLASIHGSRLYELRDLDAMPPTHAAAIRQFLTESRAFQDRLRESLDADPVLLARNSQLVWTWDYLSLAICLDWAPCTARDVPTTDGVTDLRLSAAPEQNPPRSLIVDPWPFAVDALSVRCEGRRLNDRFETDDALAAALDRAPWEAIEFELRPDSD